MRSRFIEIDSLQPTFIARKAATMNVIGSTR
jgi:hypothetical protein